MRDMMNLEGLRGFRAWAKIHKRMVPRDMARLSQLRSSIEKLNMQEVERAMPGILEDFESKVREWELIKGDGSPEVENISFIYNRIGERYKYHIFLHTTQFDTYLKIRDMLTNVAEGKEMLESAPRLAKTMSR